MAEMRLGTEYMCMKEKLGDEHVYIRLNLGLSCMLHVCGPVVGLGVGFEKVLEVKDQHSSQTINIFIQKVAPHLLYW